jgi:hypothetical protein
MPLISSTERIAMRGLPGEEQKLHVFFSTADRKFDGRRVSLPGEFKVQFLLSRPGHQVFDERNPSFIHTAVGDSHLRIAKHISERTEPSDAISLKLIGNGIGWSIPFDCLVNDNGCVGKIVVERLRANDYIHAEAVAYRALAPFLSAWSASLDIPLSVETIQVTDLNTHTESLRVLHPYLEMKPGGGVGPPLSDEYCHFASVYREAMNATSVFYRFLCFYKIVESFYLRRNKLAEQAKVRGEEPRKYTEDVPLSTEAIRGILLWIYPWRRDLDDELIISQILPEEAIGKRFKTLREKILEPMRDTIAHGLMRSGEIKAVADRLEDLENVSKWLPLLRIWVRVLFATEFPTEFGTGTVAPSNSSGLD